MVTEESTVDDFCSVIYCHTRRMKEQFNYGEVEKGKQKLKEWGGCTVKYQI